MKLDKTEIFFQDIPFHCSAHNKQPRTMILADQSNDFIGLKGNTLEIKAERSMQR